MENLEKQFEEYLQLENIGKRFIIEEWLKEFSVLFTGTKSLGYNLIKKIVGRKDGGLPIPHIDFIDNFDLNACAFIHRKYDFIGLNSGAIFIIFVLFNRILSSSNLLLEVGDAQLENTPDKFYDSIINFKNIDPDDVVLPSCPIRNTHAQLLCMSVLKFLIIHEYAHLIFGHVHLNDKQRGKSHLIELEGDNIIDSKIGGLTRQTLEMDADVFAANIGIREVIDTVISHKQNNTQAPTFYETVESGIYYWYFGIYTMFKLFDRPYNISDLGKLDYPPSAIRNFYIMSTVETYFQDSKYPKHHFADIVVRAMMDSERVLDEIFYNEINKQALSQEHIITAMNHSSKLTHNWKNIAPLLEPFSRASLDR